jgi:hypothetical protein
MIVKDSAIDSPLVFDHGKYVLLIPSSGELRVKDVRPFGRWHAEWCRDTEWNERRIESRGAEAATNGGTYDDGAIHRRHVE